MKPIISSNIRVRYPDKMTVGEYSVVDDFSYFSTGVQVGKFSHIASNCTIAGGPTYLFTLGDYSSVSAGCRIWCASDDFVNDLVAILPSSVVDLKTYNIGGNVEMGNYTALGANSVIMPNNKIPEGVSIGALSFVPTNFKFKTWTVYAGSPIREVGSRNKKSVLSQLEKIEKALSLALPTKLKIAK